MTPTPEIKPLSRTHRRLAFLLAIVLFVLGVPTLVFYAIGYRIDLTGETRNIRAVGGMYISADAEDISIYLDGEPVEDMRMFLNAAYIQNLDAGKHTVHVQGENIKTWTKELPVFAHFVTEAASFNLPTTTQMRLITPYLTQGGVSVVSPRATSTFSFASSTNSFYATTTTATSTFVANPEYVYLSTLFASTTERRTRMRQQELENRQRFRFPGETIPVATSTLLSATSTKVRGGLSLRKEGDEVAAVWDGAPDQGPYYFCVTYLGRDKTAELYGEHVAADLISEYASTTGVLPPELIGTQLCRSSVRIDRKWQWVQYFDFLPENEDLVLMQLQDGVYVVEIDDRSWQNTQLLYPGDYLSVLIDSGNIFIKDGENILEVFTELQQ